MTSSWSNKRTAGLRGAPRPAFDGCAARRQVVERDSGTVSDDKLVHPGKPRQALEPTSLRRIGAFRASEACLKDFGRSATPPKLRVKCNHIYNNFAPLTWTVVGIGQSYDTEGTKPRAETALTIDTKRYKRALREIRSGKAFVWG